MSATGGREFSAEELGEALFTSAQRVGESVTETH